MINQYTLNKGSSRQLSYTVSGTPRDYGVTSATWRLMDSLDAGATTHAQLTVTQIDSEQGVISDSGAGDSVAEVNFVLTGEELDSVPDHARLYSAVSVTLSNGLTTLLEDTVSLVEVLPRRMP